MRTDPETTRIVRSWLEEGRTALPDHILDAVLAQVPATPQRRSLWPARRIADMNTFAKLAMAAAAVVVVAIVGINLLPGSSGVGAGPTVSPSPTASPSSTSQPTPAPTLENGLPVGMLPVGSRLSVTAAEGTRFSFEVPGSDWYAGGFLGHVTNSIDQRAEPRAVVSAPWGVHGVFSDPCQQVPAPAAGPSAADLASAVAAIPDVDTTEPVDVTVGGHPGKYVEVTIPETLPCEPNSYQLWWWDTPCGDVVPYCSRWASDFNSKIRIWIFDLEGQRLWIEAETHAGIPPELDLEIQQMIDSIQFE